jgi:serine/threonine protein kinase
MAETDEPLIQQCPACAELIDVSSLEPLSAVLCPSCGAPSVVSTHIDQFELLDVLGRGGMGVVYRALDTSLNRHVALKLLRKSEGASAEQIAQLANEAAITASINHPNVVKVFTTGMDRGRFYIAMELVDQGTLDQLITLQGRVAEAQVLQVGIQIAQGLRAAQHAGLIHRDVKPGNILFADSHTAKIVDFGLAIFMEDEEKVRGEIWGTPYYVAPEKLDNKPEDFRSDIYSLGGTLFHALAGRPPFEAENASLVALKHLKSQAVSLQAFAPWVSGSTAFVINRTLNKDPEQRYQSYDELIEHLEYARTELQNAKPPAAKRVVIQSESETKLMGFLSLLLVILLIGGGVAVYIYRDQLFKKADFSDSTPGPAPSASAPGKAAGMFPEACAKLTEGKAVEAADAFRRAGAQPRLAPGRVAWAHLLEGLAEAAADHPVLADDAFKKLVNRPPFSTAPADEKLAAFFPDVARQMTGPAPIPPNAAANRNKTNHEAIAPLLFGVKNWQLGRAEDAVQLLREFSQTKPAGQDAWIADLKPFAERLIEEFTAFQVAADGLRAAKNPKQKQAAIDALKKVQGKLAGRAKEEIAKAGP